MDYNILQSFFGVRRSHKYNIFHCQCQRREGAQSQKKVCHFFCEAGSRARHLQAASRRFCPHRCTACQNKKPYFCASMIGAAKNGSRKKTRNAENEKAAVFSSASRASRGRKIPGCVLLGPCPKAFFADFSNPQPCASPALCEIFIPLSAARRQKETRSVSALIAVKHFRGRSALSPKNRRALTPPTQSFHSLLSALANQANQANQSSCYSPEAMLQ